MFILTNIDVNQDLVQVFDTQDGSNDVIRLSVIASNVTNRGLKIYGLGKLGRQGRNTATPLPMYGVYVDVMEAKEAFATFYQQKGIPRHMARQRAGLSV